jgi:hypothetical protein
MSDCIIVVEKDHFASPNIIAPDEIVAQSVVSHLVAGLSAYPFINYMQQGL